MKDLDEKLLNCAEEGDLEGMKDGLEKGAELNANSMFTGNSLHIASSKGYLEIVQFMVEQNVV